MGRKFNGPTISKTFTNITRPVQTAAFPKRAPHHRQLYKHDDVSVHACVLQIVHDL